MSGLPPRVQSLVDAIGEPHALAVVRAFGGLPLYVPLKPSPALLDRLGPAAAYALVEAFGGENFGILPSCHARMLKDRNRRWLDAAEQGKSLVEIAAAEKANWRTVFNGVQSARAALVGKNLAPPRQASLFDD